MKIQSRKVILQERRNYGNYFLFYVVLPKKFVKKNGWKKGDTINIQELGDMLILTNDDAE